MVHPANGKSCCRRAPVLPTLKFWTSNAAVEDPSRLIDWSEQSLSISRIKPTIFAE
jgi:hypothetical protein